MTGIQIETLNLSFFFIYLQQLKAKYCLARAVQARGEVP